MDGGGADGWVGLCKAGGSGAPSSFPLLSPVKGQEWVSISSSDKCGQCTNAKDDDDTVVHCNFPVFLHSTAKEQGFYRASALRLRITSFCEGFALQPKCPAQSRVHGSISYRVCYVAGNACLLLQLRREQDQFPALLHFPIPICGIGTKVNHYGGCLPSMSLLKTNEYGFVLVGQVLLRRANYGLYFRGDVCYRSFY